MFLRHRQNMTMAPGQIFYVNRKFIRHLSFVPCSISIANHLGSFRKGVLLLVQLIISFLPKSDPYIIEEVQVKYSEYDRVNLKSDPEN